MKILLIGQGIAGTMLAWSLQNRGAQVFVAEGCLPGDASSVAAGIINPVTGKRFVKSWQFDDFFSVAQTAYQSLEQTLNIEIWSEQSIVRLLASPEEANDWALRYASPDYAELLGETTDAGAWSRFLQPGFRFGVIRQAARVDFQKLMAAYRQKAIEEGVFLQKKIDCQQIEQQTNGYDTVIFCEGWRGEQNPFFPNLHWQLAKGEALLIRLKDEQASSIEAMLKKTVTLVPLGNGVFWAGGSYQWHFPHLLPSEGEKNFILNHLKEMLAAPFEVIGHRAGVRPTVKDRRPLVGQSQANPKFFIFNGLGTKGALLAPYWAAHFAQHLLEGKPLDAAVDIRRFT